VTGALDPQLIEMVARPKAKVVNPWDIGVAVIEGLLVGAASRLSRVRFRPIAKVQVEAESLTSCLHLWVK
jgi:hypothetical protein